MPVGGKPVPMGAGGKKIFRKQEHAKIAKEFCAELLGTMVLLMFGCGCVAQSILSNKANGEMLSINIGWGLGVLLGILVAGPISGEEM